MRVGARRSRPPMSNAAPWAVNAGNKFREVALRTVAAPTQRPLTTPQAVKFVGRWNFASNMGCQPSRLREYFVQRRV